MGQANAININDTTGLLATTGHTQVAAVEATEGGVRLCQASGEKAKGKEKRAGWLGPEERVKGKRKGRGGQ